ncbi:MAG: tetratricopeptide repeat protein [Thermodesulfobacteriota bacterium]|nr:tetratricopeptide repeat protein [Thermodesulfobacteriota bacterium]
MQGWKIIGVIATLIIVLALPLYMFKQIHRQAPAEKIESAAFVGSDKCGKCHKREYEEWQESHHAKAMAVADDETVLGDFDDAIFDKKGVVSRFYRKEGRFFVHTPGPDSQMGDFEITHTFGWYPLQQYLIPFPGGRMQCLPIAWDEREKKWFHLYPDLDLNPEEWIYWTNQGQNWNSMCADCHSTKLQKNYDPHTDTYDTRWAEISVGCEACHGPGSKHLAWAELPEMARVQDDDGLLVRTSGTNNRQQVDLCAPCHSRRSILGDYSHLQQDLLDTEIPRLIEERLYYADGQILDEVYVYGSFVQSKMYANDVRCSDCHNAHTIKPHHEGNALCLQCHQASIYDTKDHHFHKKEGEKGEAIRAADGKILFEVGTGALCVQCHMPGRMYMVNDYRPDHSIRIPRPDLSVELGMPNSCNYCHVDKNNEWSAEHTKKWYGIKQKFHYGTTFNASRKGEALTENLILIVTDNLAPILVRATALSLLGRYQGDVVIEIFRQALENEESIIRRTALSSLPGMSSEERIKMAGPLLNDPIKGVRIEAARALTHIPADQLAKRWRKPFDKALEEFRQIALYSADFAASRLNLGALASFQGQLDKAEEHFKKAVAIDRDFYTARTNLAVLYSRQGKNDLAEEQLRKALAGGAKLYDVHYSLGLLLSEQKQYEEAAKHLKKAAAGMPGNARAHYNLGQLLVFLQQDEEAEIALQRTIEIEPENMNYLLAIAKLYLAKGKLSLARNVAEQMIIVDSKNPLGHRLLNFITTQEQ